MKRALLVVLDGVGCGALPDADRYGDEGTNTLSHVVAATGIELPNLAALGLGRVPGVEGIARNTPAGACHGRMAEGSQGKDSTAGHWELAGLVVEKAFPTYPDGFPRDLIHAFEERIGLATIGNIPCSGTEIIARLGAEHQETGKPIVYTSADSVFQIAAHEDVIPLERLYTICREARAILDGENAVARVIARPFTGTPGNFVRTAARRDFSLEPPGPTLLTSAVDAGLGVLAIGKIHDLYAGAGITRHQPSKGNTATVALLHEAILARGFSADGLSADGFSADGLSAERQTDDGPGLVLANLVDFDMLYGHRNDAPGFARALCEFDDALPDLLAALGTEDLLVITADHGNDPTTSGTDHTREYVPLLVYGPGLAAGRDLGTRSTFADAGATIAAHLGLPPLRRGKSFLEEILP
jgi:phosphopentomutase